MYTHCAGLPCPDLAPGTTNTPAERTIHDWKEVFSEANVETVSSPNMLKSITEMLKTLSNQRCAKTGKHVNAIVCQTSKHMPVTLIATAQLQLLICIRSIMFVPFTAVMACKFPHLHKTLWQHSSFAQATLAAQLTCQSDM